ncbi:hypothetical protein I3A86_23885 [Salmonella enterica]|nr:hypothetical protein [Salmonella enterica]
MPRFFFDVLDGRCAPDEIGTSLSSERDAREEAIRRALILLKVIQPKEGRGDTKDCVIKVKDEFGDVLWHIDVWPGVQKIA